MQIVLLQDVKSLGKKGEIVKVNDGYARNFILPKHLGEEATQENLAKLSGQKKYEAKVAAENLAAAQDLAARIAKEVVKVSVKAGSAGRVFGSISNKEIAEAASAQYGLEIDKKKIVLDEPIKTVGEHEVLVKLHKDVQAKLKLIVEAV